MNASKEFRTEGSHPLDTSRTSLDANYVLVEDLPCAREPNLPVTASQSQEMDRGDGISVQCQGASGNHSNSNNYPTENTTNPQDDDEWEWDKTSPSRDTDEYLENCCCCCESNPQCPSDANLQLLCLQTICLPCHYGCDAGGLCACCETGMCMETCIQGFFHCCCGAMCGGA